MVTNQNTGVLPPNQIEIILIKFFLICYSFSGSCRRLSVFAYTSEEMFLWMDKMGCEFITAVVTWVQAAVFTYANVS